jgi:hypothetical protein
MSAAISITAGFIYVAVYRDYIFLVTGITKGVSLGNPELVNWLSAAIGLFYSSMLATFLVTFLILWFKPPSTIRL